MPCEEARARHVEPEVAFEPLEQRLEVLPHVVSERRPLAGARLGAAARLLVLLLAGCFGLAARRERGVPFDLPQQAPSAPLDFDVVLLRGVLQRRNGGRAELAQLALGLDPLPVALGAELTDQGADIGGPG